MIGFIIWSVVACILAGIGVSCRKHKEPVGFFTFVKPPQPAGEKIVRYNRAVSVLWFVSAALLELIGLPLLFAEQNSPVFLFVVFGCIVWLIGLIIAYIKIADHYTQS